MADLQQNPNAGKGPGSRQRRKSTRIDMTAMVDVAFLLLTFFILTTTLATPKALKLTLPTNEDGKTVDVKCSNIMEIFPGSNGQVHWYAGCDRNTVATTGFGDMGIRKVIRENLQANPDLIINLKPTDASTYQNLVDILDEMKITGAPRYALAALAPADLDLLNSKDLK